MSRCGMRRFDKHMTADRPSNSSLHQENQQRLSQLIQEREKMDMGQSVYEPIVSDKAVPMAVPMAAVKEAPIVTSNVYTPWKTPSTLRF